MNNPYRGKVGVPAYAVEEVEAAWDEGFAAALAALRAALQDRQWPESDPSGSSNEGFGDCVEECLALVEALEQGAGNEPRIMAEDIYRETGLTPLDSERFRRRFGHLPTRSSEEDRHE